jgi:iduronate 2-sulfatase
MLFILIFLFLSLSGFANARKEYPPLPQTNLLFIMFDDLRPELSVYGKKHMITPNFERLAKRSVVFDIAVTQVAVCNPSRDSLLTGLRPDAMGHYNFQQSYFPHKLFPQHLIAAGYKTAAYGKVRHWDGKDASMWTEDQFDGPVEKQKGKNKKATDYMGWYEYQDHEWRSMRSSVMPDKEKTLESYPDHVIATRAAAQIRKFAAGSAPWMTAVGFKMPHTALHVPYSYWERYNSTQSVWRALAREGRSFPKDTPPVAYRCCAEPHWRFMKEEGAAQSTKSEPLGDYRSAVSEAMYVESMQGYAAAVTFVDEQLGRVLDVLDELNLWETLTVVLTADHGMHNGEKAIWEKWTLFDEATRVPLMIAHPKSPYKSTHSFDPVELVDIYPTVLDLVASPHIRQHHGHGNGEDGKVTEHKPVIVPSGKSLAPLVVGHRFSLFSSQASHHWTHRKHAPQNPGKQPVPAFGVSQSVRCAQKREARTDIRKSAIKVDWNGIASATNEKSNSFYKVWNDCDLNADNATISNEVSLMGYSARSAAFRYTLWVHFDRTQRLPAWWRGQDVIFDEELYDHRTEELGGLTLYENANIAGEPEFREILLEQRRILLEWLRTLVYKHGTDEEYQRHRGAFFAAREANATAAAISATSSSANNGDSVAHPVRRLLRSSKML